MSTTSIALFVILALVLFSIALLYKNKVNGKIKIFGMQIDLTASGNLKQRKRPASQLPEASSEVNIQADMKDTTIEQVAGRDINDHDGGGEKAQSSKSKVVIGGKLRNVDLDQVAGRDIKKQSPKNQLTKQKSRTPEGKTK
jgi:hypothetical protein